MDGVSIKDVACAPAGVAGFLKDLHETLKAKRCRPRHSALDALQAIKRGLEGWTNAFMYERDHFGRAKRFLNMVPSARACARERARIRELVHAGRSFVPITRLIEEVNLQLSGWAAYFNKGRSRPAFRHMNWFVLQRMVRHLKRRSQRPYHPPAGTSWYQHLHQQLGLVQL